MDLEKSDKLQDINLILNESFSPYFTDAFSRGETKEQVGMNTITGLSSFVSDVNNGIIGGIRGWVNNLSWSSTAYNNVTWGSGTLTLSNGSSYSITGASTTLTTVTYIFLDTAVSVTALQVTTVASNSVGPTRILVCVANLTIAGKDAQFQIFGGAGSQTFINADNIAAGTITANEIASNTITSNNILTGTIQADKIDVTNLFAQTITATGTITGATLQTAISGARSTMSPGGNITATDAAGNTISVSPTNNQIGFQNGVNSAYFRFRINSGVANLETDAILRTYSALYASGVSTGQIDASGTIFANGKMKLPVGTNLY